jgi:hypothetical protein
VAKAYVGKETSEQAFKLLRPFIMAAERFKLERRKNNLFAA